VGVAKHPNSARQHKKSTSKLKRYLQHQHK
jgi:hypothetical protein